MGGLARLGGDVLRMIAGRLAARDRFELARCSRDMYKELWPRSDSFGKVTEVAQFDTAMALDMPNLPFASCVSRDGQTIAALALAAAGGVTTSGNTPSPQTDKHATLVLWHVPTRKVRQMDVNVGSAAGELELRVSDNGARVAVLHSRTAQLFLYQLAPALDAHGSLGVTEHCIRDERLARASAFAISPSGEQLAVYTSPGQLVHVLGWSTSALVQTRMWSLAGVEQPTVAVSEMHFALGERGHASELCIVFRGPHGTGHHISMFSCETGQQVRCIPINTTQRICAVAASGDLLAFNDIDKDKASARARARRNVRCDVFLLSDTAAAATCNDDARCVLRVLSQVESVKLRRYEPVVRRACALYERRVCAEVDGYGRKKWVMQRAVVGVSTDKNRWVLRATLVPAGTDTARCDSTTSAGQDTAHRVPLVYSSNALSEDSALVTFSRDAHWALLARFEDTSLRSRTCAGKSARRVLFGLQNVMLLL